MGADSKIAWTDHTFSPWWGCVRVSPGCQNCYAEAWAKRTGHPVWGVAAPRRFFGEKHWREPLRWARAAEESGVKARVFCSSMADVFEDRRDLDGERARLWRLIAKTCRALDWLLLTKRPENLVRLGDPETLRVCWVGTTAEDQQRFDERIPHLLATPAAVRFVSCEPLLGPVDLANIGLNDDQRPVSALLRHPCVDDGPPEHGIGLDWVIVGGESGPKARRFDLAWARSLRDQCRAAAVPFFFKQTGSAPQDTQTLTGFETFSDEGRRAYPNGATSLVVGWKPKDRAGADPAEWPEDLRVREWPGERTAAKQK